jgi:hypothetical protein
MSSVSSPYVTGFWGFMLHFAQHKGIPDEDPGDEQQEEAKAIDDQAHCQQRHQHEHERRQHIPHAYDDVGAIFVTMAAHVDALVNL